MNTRKAAAKKLPTDHDAERLCGAIHALGEYAHVTVRAHRGRLNVYAGEQEPVARLTPLGGGSFGLSFRRHTGRREPMPFSGELKKVAHDLVSMLGIYLQRWDFSDRKSKFKH